MPAPEDTIVAIATPAGRSGLGLVRLSGAQASEIAGRLLGGIALAPRHATLARFRDAAGEVLDE
ncbi:MAG: tRNA uridine-5-carboxymethylaminomethyl(34) synthesis GTPase MnmE, partial [Terriglobales bacterium]